MKLRLPFFVCAVAVMLSLIGCAPNKRMMVAQTVLEHDRVADEVLVRSGKEDPDTKQVLYNVVVRVCTLGPNGARTNCKETVVIENVSSDRVYP